MKRQQIIKFKVENLTVDSIPAKMFLCVCVVKNNKSVILRNHLSLL
jgi:hypothetical protein